MPADPNEQFKAAIDDIVEIYIDKTVTEPTVDKGWFIGLIVEVDEPHPSDNILGAPKTRLFSNHMASKEIMDRESWSNEYMAMTITGAIEMMIGLSQKFEIPPDVLIDAVQECIDRYARPNT